MDGRCARCIELLVQLQRAALLLRRLQPAIPVALATVDMSDPINVGWSLDGVAGGVASFPVGKLTRPLEP